ncbi:MAG: hypothetical protein ACW986_13155 [Promethearchaeota archaeon]|jgi:hypothetical protein
MNQNKFSPKTQQEIESFLEKTKLWEHIFSFKIEFYFDGWAIFLKENHAYPRCIVVFRSYENGFYSIRSYELQLLNFKKEKYNELYFVGYIKNQTQLIKELKDIIYGKDLGEQIRRINQKTFTA